MSVAAVEILLSILLVSIHGSCADCNVVSSNYFQWISPDGYLVSNTLHNAVDSDERNCSSQWQNLAESASCRFCSATAALVCAGSDEYSPPEPSTLPITNFTFIKLSGTGLISLPPKCFENLTIGKLLIGDSNLTYMSSDSFLGIKFIESLELKNNTIDYIYDAGHLFRGLNGLKSLSVEYCGLRVISSNRSSLLSNLQYFSLAGNPLYDFDVYFLQNSRLKTLNLSSVTFKLKPVDIKESGLKTLPRTLETVDLGYADITFKSLEMILNCLCEKHITTLNLSFLKSKGPILTSLLPLKNSLQYLSLMGVNLDYSVYKEKKILNTSGPFINLEELNMNNCSLADTEPELFYAFKNVKSLSIAKNQFVYLKLELFKNLPNLHYLNYGQNYIADVRSNTKNSTFASKNLNVLDLSGVNIVLDKLLSEMLFNSLQNVEELSLCGATLNIDQVLAMNNLKNLKILDLSNTVSMVPALESAYDELFTNNNNLLLSELYFTKNMLNSTSKHVNMFSKLLNLGILDLSNNLLQKVTSDMFGPVVKHVKLSQNLITTWYSSLIKSSSIKKMNLSSNQITYVSNPMLEDFNHLNSLDLSNNPLICHSKIVSLVCENMMHNLTGNVTLIEWQQYQCYDVTTNDYRKFSQPHDCNVYFQEVSTTPESPYASTSSSKNQSNSKVFLLNWIYILISSLIGSFAIAVALYTNWWKIKCFLHRFLSLRKAQLIRKDGNLLSKPEVHYDVFVSYSDVDRAWVLDHLISNMEEDGDISLCFHERDFQVGLSILENIIECMDRSNMLLLIVSSSFVRSKWCQFEMHLAQHRLIETFRDQLVLVLLEDIPRKGRPQMLHHMMMTKTYLVWPGEASKNDAVELFWKRLRRALKSSQPHMPELKYV